jgi:hypothetical protein
LTTKVFGPISALQASTEINKFVFSLEVPGFAQFFYTQAILFI